MRNRAIAAFFSLLALPAVCLAQAPAAHTFSFAPHTATVPLREAQAGSSVTAGTLYAVGTGLNGASSIFSIDSYATSPVANPIATFTGRLFDVAIDPTTLGFYVIDEQSQLYRIDLENLTATPLGIGASGANALVFDRFGQAYEWGADQFLYLVDKNTGHATAVGNTGYSAAGDLAFDLDGTLYGTTADGFLIRIDPASGHSTLVGDTGFDDLFGLAVDSSGSLFAGSGSLTAKISKIYRIDKTTGSSALIASVTNDSDSIAGFALAPAAAPANTTLFLSNGRFRVGVTWATSNASGVGTPVQLTSDTGYFWFFNSANVEMVIKVLNGCGLGGHYWVFAGGLTNVHTVITVTDSQTGLFKTYTTRNGPPFAPIQDTSAFATCP